MDEKKLTIGAVIEEPASTRATKTGSWRAFRPVLDSKKCIKCGTCWKFCPDSAIDFKDGGYSVNYDYCKGCLICFKECPVKAISRELEEK
jgi:pyruvate ferredoxin oxidoreductase delta subunit